MRPVYDTLAYTNPRIMPILRPHHEPPSPKGPKRLSKTLQSVEKSILARIASLFLLSACQVPHVVHIPSPPPSKHTQENAAEPVTIDSITELEQNRPLQTKADAWFLDMVQRLESPYTSLITKPRHSRTKEDVENFLSLVREKMVQILEEYIKERPQLRAAIFDPSTSLGASIYALFRAYGYLVYATAQDITVGNTLYPSTQLTLAKLRDPILFTCADFVCALPEKTHFPESSYQAITRALTTIQSHPLVPGHRIPKQFTYRETVPHTGFLVPDGTITTGGVYHSKENELMIFRHVMVSAEAQNPELFQKQLQRTLQHETAHFAVQELLSKRATSPYHDTELDLDITAQTVNEAYAFFIELLSDPTPGVDIFYKYIYATTIPTYSLAQALLGNVMREMLLAARVKGMTIPDGFDGVLEGHETFMEGLQRILRTSEQPTRSELLIALAEDIGAITAHPMLTDEREISFGSGFDQMRRWYAQLSHSQSLSQAP